MPKVSVIVPVFNVSEYLPKTVASIRSQSEPDLEIILVDDGSTDISGALCDGYALADSRIQVIHKQNGGLSSARNAGLDAASGEYVLFVDGDDYLAVNAIQLLLETVSAAKADARIDFVQFLYEEVHDTHWVPGAQETHTELCRDVHKMFQRLYRMGGVAASSCTKLFRRELFQSLRFCEGILHEDEQLMTHLLPKCQCVLYTDLTLYAYVMRPNSIVHAKFRPHSMDIFSVMDERIDVLKRLGFEDLVKETKTRIFQTAAWQYCLARRGGFRPESLELKRRLCALSKESDLGLSGQYKLLHRLTRLSGVAPEIYYQFRKSCGKS